MEDKFDTSINIRPNLLEKINYYSENTNFTSQEIIIRLLAYFIRMTQNCVFIDGPLVSYQIRGVSYKKLTLHLTSEEVAMLRQIRIVTLLSVSLVLYLAMILFGERLLGRLKKSVRFLKKINTQISYPEFSSFISETIKLNRYFLQFQKYP
jgi:hypothetical protein